MLATAYENGRITGELFIYALIIACGVRLVHSLRRRRSTAVNVAGIVLMLAVTLITLTGDRGTRSAPGAATISDDAYLDASRRDMIAGCTDKGARPAYCECVAEQMLERSGRDATRLRAMLAELDQTRPGSAPPAALLQVTQACADRA